MALDSGFGAGMLNALPQSPNFGNLGVVTPVDYGKIQAMALAQLESQRQTAQLQSSLASQAQARQQSAGLYPGTLAGQQAQVGQQQVAYQGALAALPVEQAKSNYALARVGPESTTSGFQRNADGTFTLTNSTTANGQPVSSSNQVTPFLGPPTDLQKNVARLPPDQQQDAMDVALGLKARASSTPYQPVTTVDSTGAKHSLLLNRQTGEVIDNATGQVISTTGLPPGQNVVDAPGSSPAAPAVNPFVGPSTAALAAAKVSGATQGERLANLSSAIAKAKTDDLNLSNFDTNVDQAISRVNSLSTQYGQALKGIPGTEANQLDSMLEPVRASNLFDTINSLKNASGQTGIGRFLQNEATAAQNVRADISPSLDAPTLIANLQRLKKLAAATRGFAQDQFNQTNGAFLNPAALQSAGISVAQLPGFAQAAVAPTALAAGPAAASSSALASGRPPVLTPEQFKAAPSGTVFQTTDGRVLRKP